ncbi:MAG: hypothetical protein K9L17_13170 [Clostridiales bacterium]|nr:hypothetical protein [Clostridiales bacterium]MCF8023630.1 hypothetical protein [Clostridiales bacterium]
MGLFKFLGKMVNNYFEDEQFKLIRVQKHGGALDLKGFYTEKRVFLYGEELTKDKICNTFGWNPEKVYFSWGKKENEGSFYLANAILLEVYDKERLPKLVDRFIKDCINRLPEEDFEYVFPIQQWFNNDVNPRSKKLQDTQSINGADYDDD